MHQETSSGGLVNLYIIPNGIKECLNSQGVKPINISSGLTILAHGIIMFYVNPGNHYIHRRGLLRCITLQYYNSVKKSTKENFNINRSF